MSSPEENPEVKAIQLHLASAKNQVSIATEHADWANYQLDEAQKHLKDVQRMLREAKKRDTDYKSATAAAAAATAAQKKRKVSPTPKKQTSQQKSANTKRTKTTIGKSGGWTDEENAQFRQGIVLCGWGKWDLISKTVIASREMKQVKSHAQKFQEYYPQEKVKLIKQHEQREKKKAAAKKTSAKKTPAKKATTTKKKVISTASKKKVEVTPPTEKKVVKRKSNGARNTRGASTGSPPRSKGSGIELLSMAAKSDLSSLFQPSSSA